MSGWMMARGRTNETSLEEVTAAGVRNISLTGADALFAVGDFLLISEADGSETQWLGRVTATSASGVSFTVALARSKNTGARLWRAASVLELTGLDALRERRTLATGVVVERSLGGDFLAVKVSEPRDSASLAVSGLTPQNEQALLDWLREETGWGLEAFALIGPAGEMTAVRLSGEAITRETGKGTRVSMTMPIMTVGKGIYP